MRKTFTVIMKGKESEIDAYMRDIVSDLPDGVEFVGFEEIDSKK